MRKHLFSLRNGLLILSIVGAFAASPAYAQSDLWVTGYYAGWSQGWFNNGVLPAQDIDYSALTHIIHFGLVPNSDGSINSDANSIRESNSSELISRAHAAGKKVLICVGGWGTDVAFRGATSLLTLPVFVDNLVSFMISRGYDGIDVDWEVLDVTDRLQYTLLITTLRARLDQITPRPLLTAAVQWQPLILAALANDFDQINVMSYDLSGAWPGWVSWHNAPLTSSGLVFPSTGRLRPSAETLVNDLVSAGFPANKISIGIDFYGYVWRGGSGTPTGGVTAPGQSWNSAPSVQANVPYSTLMPKYYQPSYFRWDSLAQASYLSIDNPGSANDMFITYDNELSCAKKVEFARARGIGGVFIWELGGGRLPNGYPGRDRLLQAVKNAAQMISDPPPPPAATSPLNNTVGTSTTPLISWSPSLGADWYHLQIATDSTFSSNAIAQDWIIWNSFQVTGLSLNTPYFWRLSSYTPTGTSTWSRPSTFQTIADLSLPTTWAYISNTGSSATITVPAGINPTIGTQALRAGDAIGVFYLSNGIPTCAGYGVWKGNSDLVFTVWGDDPQTTWTDGLAEGDSLVFRIWSGQAQEEFPATALFQSGGPTFTKGSTVVLSSLQASPIVKQTIVLSPGANLISSFVRPVDSTLSAVFSKIRPGIVTVQAGNGASFVPDSGINTIGAWDIHQGYRVFVSSSDTLIISGEEASPDRTPIAMSRGWNLVSYLRHTPLAADSAFGSAINNLVLVKDNTGNVYWPAVDVNTLGSLVPGQGYQVYVKDQSTLLYPPNRGPITRADLEPVAGTRVPGTFGFQQHLSGQGYNTGSNATLLVDSPDLQDGDEVMVRTASMLVGSGSVTGGKALVTVLGDNRTTPNVVEGARENETMSLSVLPYNSPNEHPLVVSSIVDGLSGAPVAGPIRYMSDAVWIASIKSVPVGFRLDQNFPNPFNPSTTIRYSLPAAANVRLEVYDILGRKIETLVNQIQQAGDYQAVFNERNLPSGVYFYRIRIQWGGVTPLPGTTLNPLGLTTEVTRKMIILR